jgi:hypothetical protein
MKLREVEVSINQTDSNRGLPFNFGLFLVRINNRNPFGHVDVCIEFIVHKLKFI